MVCVLVNVLEGTGVEMLRTRIKHGVVEFDGMVNNGGGKTVESPADEPQGKQRSVVNNSQLQGDVLSVHSRRGAAETGARRQERGKRTWPRIKPRTSGDRRASGCLIVA